MSNPIIPWKKISSEYPLKNRWYTVRKDTVEIKPGKIIDDYFLAEFPEIVAIVAETKNGEVVLVRQYKHGASQIVSEVPCGYVNEAEEPLAAAKRELLEETGYSALSWSKVGYFLVDPSKVQGGGTHIFFAKNAQKTHKQNLDQTENIEVFTVSKQRIAGLVGTEVMVAGSALALALVYGTSGISSQLTGH